MKNPHILEAVELKYAREHPLTLEQRFDLFQWMYELAKDMGHFDSDRGGRPSQDNIALAKILNAQIQPPSGRHSKGA